MARSPNESRGIRLAPTTRLLIRRCRLLADVLKPWHRRETVDDVVCAATRNYWNHLRTKAAARGIDWQSVLAEHGDAPPAARFQGLPDRSGIADE